MSQRTTDRSDRIHDSLSLSRLPASGIDSLSVTESGWGPVWSSFVDFHVTKFRQNYLQRHLKEKGILKILTACHSGAAFQPGALRTCVPCLMVYPALIAMVVSYRLSIVTVALSVTIRPQFASECLRRSNQQGWVTFWPKFKGVPLGADPSCWGCKERTSQVN